MTVISTELDHLSGMRGSPGNLPVLSLPLPVLWVHLPLTSKRFENSTFPARRQGINVRLPIVPTRPTHPGPPLDNRLIVITSDPGDLVVRHPAEHFGILVPFGYEVADMYQSVVLRVVFDFLQQTPRHCSALDIIDEGGFTHCRGSYDPWISPTKIIRFPVPRST